MLGDRRIVIVLRAERLLKPKRAGRSAETRRRPADGAEGEEERGRLSAAARGVRRRIAGALDDAGVRRDARSTATRRLTKRLIEKAPRDRVRRPDGRRRDGPRREPRPRCRSGSRGRSGRGGTRTIDPEAVRHARRSRRRRHHEAARRRRAAAALHGRPEDAITRDDVDGGRRRPSRIDDDWAVVNAIGEGDAGAPCAKPALRLDRGDSPHALVGQLRWWVSTGWRRASPTASSRRSTRCCGRIWR